jgi:hypothetical protein
MPLKAPSLFRNSAFSDLAVDLLSAYLNSAEHVDRLQATFAELRPPTRSVTAEHWARPHRT